MNQTNISHLYLVIYISHVLRFQVYGFFYIDMIISRNYLFILKIFLCLVLPILITIRSTFLPFRYCWKNFYYIYAEIVKRSTLRLHKTVSMFQSIQKTINTLKKEKIILDHLFVSNHVLNVFVKLQLNTTQIIHKIFTLCVLFFYLAIFYTNLIVQLSPYIFTPPLKLFSCVQVYVFL